MSLRDATVRLLDDWLARTQHAARVPSLSVAVARRGTTVWSGAIGSVRPGGDPATRLTRYRIGSITKPIVAVAVLRLVAEGRLSLEEPLGDLLPGSPVPRASVADLLCHTSGLAAEPPGPWWERSPGPTWEQLVASAPPTLTAPGRRHHYSNTGYALLGRLLEVLEGEPWEAVARRRTLDPLGMGRTGRSADQDCATGIAVHPYADTWHPEPSPDHGAMGPAGELWSTPSDLVRLGGWTLDAPGSPDLLPPDLKEQMSEPRALTDTPGVAWTTAQGLGLQIWNVAGRRRWGHSGSVPGFTAELRCDQATGDVVALCASATHGVGAGEELLDLLAATEPAPVPIWSPDPAQAGLAELCGTWYWGPSPYTVRAHRAPRVGAPVLELAPLGPGRRSTTFAPADGGWVGVAGDYWLGERLRVLRRSNGAPYALDVGTFHFTRAPYAPDTGVPGAVPDDDWR